MFRYYKKNIVYKYTSYLQFLSVMFIYNIYIYIKKNIVLTKYLNRIPEIFNAYAMFFLNILFNFFKHEWIL